MKSVIFSLAGLLFATFCLSTVPVLAQSAEPMTDEHIALIKSNCNVARATLSRIHANDAPIYINRNQTYYSISDKLMARLNSRLTLNRFDAADLVKTASTFNTELSKFRSTYKEYNDLITDAIHMDCKKQPVSFYDKVGDAREAREKVNTVTVHMSELINQYSDQVEAFKTEHFKDKEEGSS